MSSDSKDVPGAEETPAVVEDDEEEDLKDLVKDMGLEDDEVARFRVAIVELPRVKARVAKEAKEAEEAKQTEEATGRTHG